MRAALLVLPFTICSLSAQTPRVSERWTMLAFLIGEWTGEGGTAQDSGPGQGSGGFSFLPDQNGTVLVRKNRADYPAAKDRPAYSHTDLMIVYHEDAKLRAIYFDSYDVEASADGESVRFLSEGYRLTYRKTGNDTVAIKFEVAGAQGGFTTYIEASARRKPGR